MALTLGKWNRMCDQLDAFLLSNGRMPRREKGEFGLRRFACLNAFKHTTGIPSDGRICNAGTRNYSTKTSRT